MSTQSQGSMLIVGAIAGGIGFVAFVALMILGEYAFSPALFLALVVAAAAAAFLFLGFHRKSSDVVSPAGPSLAQPRDMAPVTAEPGTAGVAPGSAGVEPGSAGVKVRPGTLLAGEQELAARKGAWTYQAAPAAAPVAAPAPAAAPVVAPAPADDTPLADDGAGKEPERLQGPRDGQTADDLKRIKGVGPKLEEMLHGMGFYHFDQIANWTAGEVAWVDDNLEGFKGRVSRDDWVAQAKILAEGGETEFSNRVDDGDVYT